MDLHPSAFKHGCGADDVVHAIRHAVVIDDVDDDLRLYLGAATDGALLEVHAGQVSASDASGVTMTDEGYGHTASGQPITDDLVDELARRAEEGVDVDEVIRRRGGRPPMGSAAASVESVRLDPELSRSLRERAEREGRTNSELIREALRRYLRAS